MGRLGYDPEELLRQARLAQAEYDFEEPMDQTSSPLITSIDGASPAELPEEPSLRDAEETCYFPAPPNDEKVYIDKQKIQEILDAPVKDALEKQAPIFFGLLQGILAVSLGRILPRIFSFLTDAGIYTPTRVMMGGTDSVAYCQSTVQEMFKDLLYNGVLIWLEDILGYSDTIEGLLELLTKVLDICIAKGLKLNPSKCHFFLTEAVWCGRVISSSGQAQPRTDPGAAGAARATDWAGSTTIPMRVKLDALVFAGF